MSDDTGENRDETEQPGNARDLVDELAGDYAKYFVIDTSKEISQFEEAIEQNLTHLEEFCGILDVMRSEEISNADYALISVAAKIDQLDTVFNQIDKLANFVDMVRQQVDTLDEEIVKAEKLFSNPNKVVKFFTSLLNRKLPLSEPSKPNFIEIFKTQNYINSNDTSEETEEHVSNASSCFKRDDVD